MCVKTSCVPVRQRRYGNGLHGWSLNGAMAIVSNTAGISGTYTRASRSAA